VSTISLVVPSYRRAQDLARCIQSARNQLRPFDEIIVVVRSDDAATRESLVNAPVKVLEVTEPGVLAAMTVGVRASSSDIVAFTDDDATLSTTWSQQVLQTLDDPKNQKVGGVGGRDQIFDGDVARPCELTRDVGRLTFWGRLVGNHHRGVGQRENVVVLKGVNCAYRRAALALPKGLRGEGAQAHFELAVGAYARQHGWQLNYDADLVVQHRPAPRADDDQRAAPSTDAVSNGAFNIMRSLSPSTQTRRLAYVLCVGDRACPGVARSLWALVRGDFATLRRRQPAWRGTWHAWLMRRTPLLFVTF
jgi:glycosyltransferase involved in cell wall biosynthesis